GPFVPNDWAKIILSPVVWARFPHMLLASYLTGAVCVAATGAWYLLREIFTAEARVMLRMGLYFAAVLLPAQLVFGHLNGEYIVHHQPSKMAAIEARWHDQKPASEVLLAWPDVAHHRNLFAITLPAPLGSLIDSDSLSAGEVGLESISPQNWPPVAIPFFSFRIMVGCWAIMLLVAWIASYLIHKERIEQYRPLLWVTFLSFPLPFIAILTGWVTAEVGRQPWVVYGVLHTADAMTPFLTARSALVSLVVYCVVYSFIFVFGTYYIYRLLREGPGGRLVLPPAAAVPNRPMSVAHGHRLTPPVHHIAAGE
ncbi:MAG: cytochrome ubiquinol oxidase subunit I, partial [Alphaproteobacteria bacterium]|nr:cytochrome ubiquinol oxidase subunit I [Alphaproteobacteria bacterium]